MTASNLDRFETVLLDEFRNHIASNGATASPRPRRRFTMIAAAAAATGLATISVVGLRPDPAFAVERQDDGDIVVTISELKDAADLEQALEAQGVNAYVNYLTGTTKPSDLGDTSLTGRCRPVAGGAVIDHSDSGGVTITLTAAYVDSVSGVIALTVAQGPDSDPWIGARVTSC